jgi:FixJ family two-component response regulator
MNESRISGQPRPVVAVVDDDPRILEALADLLESAGYQARSHGSARSLLASGISDIACLITDICMPVMDGLELRDQVKGIRPELPVFLISAERDARSVQSVGEGEFFPKPFDGPSLLETIGRALGKATNP